MSTKSTKTNALTELPASLAAREDTPVPQGRLSRMTRMVSTSMGAGPYAVLARLGSQCDWAAMERALADQAL